MPAFTFDALALLASMPTVGGVSMLRFSEEQSHARRRSRVLDVPFQIRRVSRSSCHLKYSGDARIVTWLEYFDPAHPNMRLIIP